MVRWHWWFSGIAGTSGSGGPESLSDGLTGGIDGTGGSGGGLPGGSGISGGTGALVVVRWFHLCYVGSTCVTLVPPVVVRWFHRWWFGGSTSGSVVPLVVRWY